MPVRYILSSVWVRGQRSNNKVTKSTGQILKVPLFRHNLSKSLAQQLKMQGKRLAILVISSYCRSTFGKEVQSSLKMAAILKMPQFSRQLQSEYKYIHYSMRRKNDVLYLQLSQRLTEQHRCEFILICSHITMWCYRPPSLTVTYLQMAASRERQGWEQWNMWNKGALDTKVTGRSCRSKVQTKVMASAYVTDFKGLYLRQFFKVRVSKLNWNAYQTMNDEGIITVIVLSIVFWKPRFQNSASSCFY